MNRLGRLTAYPDLAAVIGCQLAAFPEHEGYIRRRFEEESEAGLDFSELLAGLIVCVAGGRLDEICGDYRWLCGEMLKEELHFRRFGRYRLSTLAEALEQVYANGPFMKRYVNGILLSQLWWANHNALLRYFREVFLPGNLPGFRHLEVGPGHGLYLHMAASQPGCASAEGWDLSDVSLATTRSAIEALNSGTRIHLRKVDFTAEIPRGRFQSITFSEVLEHLEDPARALSELHRLLDNPGQIFINVPVNSPAPDHIYLFRSPEEVLDMIEGAGFKVKGTLFAPCTGASLERARRFSLGISVGVIAEKG